MLPVTDSVACYGQCCLLRTGLAVMDSVACYGQCCLLRTVLAVMDSVACYGQCCLLRTVLAVMDSVGCYGQCCLLRVQCWLLWTVLPVTCAVLAVMDSVACYVCSVGCYGQCCLLRVQCWLLRTVLPVTCAWEIALICMQSQKALSSVRLMCLQHMHGPLLVRLPAWISPLSLYSLFLVYCQQMEADELWQMELLMLYLFISSSLLFLRNGS